VVVKGLSIHLALSALSSFTTKQQPTAPLTPTIEALTAEATAVLAELPPNFEDAVGEVYVHVTHTLIFHYLT